MTNVTDDEYIDRGRRRALMRLGLAATAVYLGPVLTRLAGARASESYSASSYSGGGGGGGDSMDSPSPAPSRPAPSAPSRPRPAPRLEIVVAVPSRTDFELIAAAGMEVLGVESSALLGGAIGRVRLPSGGTLDAARAAILQRVPGALVEPNDLYRTSELSCSDGDCAAFEMIGWQQRGTCAIAPVIGMIDSGVNPQHAAFTGRRLEVVALDQGERPAAGRIHGTAIASLLIGSNQTRTPGLLPDATLIAVEAFHQDGEGDAADVFALVRALDVLARRDVSVINMSFAGPENALLSAALDAVGRQDIALVAAAGNAGPRAAPLYPAANPTVVAVTAVGSSLDVYRQANSGAYIRFAAPGVQVWTAASISGGRFRSGTSYAAPFVTAAIAAARHADPQASIDDVLGDLARSATDLGPEGRDDTFGWGLVQALGSCA